VTTRFIDATSLTRKTRGITDACFLRNRVDASLG